MIIIEQRREKNDCKIKTGNSDKKREWEEGHCGEIAVLIKYSGTYAGTKRGEKLNNGQHVVQHVGEH